MSQGVWAVARSLAPPAANAINPGNRTSRAAARRVGAIARHQRRRGWSPPAAAPASGAGACRRVVRRRPVNCVERFIRNPRKKPRVRQRLSTGEIRYDQENQQFQQSGRRFSRLPARDPLTGPLTGPHAGPHAGPLAGPLTGPIAGRLTGMLAVPRKSACSAPRARANVA
jgi:hypothetical protein